MKKIMFVVSLLLCCLILFSSTSQFVQQFDKHLAFKINPLNNHARRSFIYEYLATSEPGSDISELKPIILEGLEKDPFDGRLYSLLGFIEESQGREEEAQEFYIHARKLIQTDQYALLRRFVFQFKKGEYLKATKLAELVYLRWRNRWPLIEPFLVELFQDEDSYKSASQFFTQYKSSEVDLIKSLIKSEDVRGQDLAYRLVIDWHKSGEKNLEHLIAYTSKSLIRAEKYSNAYILFLLTLNDEQREQAGFVFNSSFDFKPTTSPFDWHIIDQAGVDIGLKKTAIKSPDDTSLEIRFLGKPTNLNNLIQHIRLPPGRLRLNVSYTNQNLKSPKPVVMGISCFKPRRLLGEVALLKSKNEQNSIDIEVLVPNDDCKMQVINVYNKNFSKSWANRITGSLLIHDVSIEKVGD
ncbi:MAG: hypothetical protein ABJ081_09870 [Hyphomicrobiales bacterium]